MEVDDAVDVLDEVDDATKKQVVDMLLRMPEMISR